MSAGEVVAVPCGRRVADGPGASMRGQGGNWTRSGGQMPSRISRGKSKAADRHQVSPGPVDASRTRTGQKGLGGDFESWLMVRVHPGCCRRS